jgi:exocyst complex component 4
MFKFSDTNIRAVSNDIKAIDESVQQALKASVPGLVIMQAAEGTGATALTGTLAIAEDRYTTAEKHRTLIPPNAFNVTTLFQPTLSFIERASVTAPAGFEEEPRAFSSVLEDFVVKVFLPQLDERVTASFQQAVSGMFSFTD